MPTDDIGYPPGIHMCGWEGVVAAAPERKCDVYSRLFAEAATAARGNGDEGAARWLTVLSDVTSPYLRSGREHLGDPFAPMWIGGGSRTVLPEDIADDDLSALETLAPSIADPELRARVADVLWVTKRRYPMALLAMPAYLCSAQCLEEAGTWPGVVDRVERSLRLAASLRQGGAAQVAAAVTYVEAMLDRYDTATDTALQAANLMELLLEIGAGDAAKYARMAKVLAISREDRDDWSEAQRYWEIRARWAERAGDSEAKRAARVAAAATHQKAADEALAKQPPDYLVEGHHLERAVQAYRQIGEREHAEALHRRLLEHQPLALGAMHTLSVPFDGDEATREAIDAVSGQRLLDALFRLATISAPPSVAQLEEEVDELAREFPLQSLISVERVDHLGRTTASRPSRFDEDPQRAAAARRADMFTTAGRRHDIEAEVLIDPARHRIATEHAVREADLLPLLVDNPFVPAGRISLFARGLRAGLEGDWVLACHLLIPQVEHSIRSLLNARGVITTSLVDESGVQDEQSLNTLLDREETRALFGEDLLFCLQGLLVERFGANLRNRMAHGIMSDEAFDTPVACYLWWLVLRLCCWSTLVREAVGRSGVKRATDEGLATNATDRAPEHGRAEYAGATSEVPAQTETDEPFRAKPS